jgi:hypothetical protein
MRRSRLTLKVDGSVLEAMQQQALAVDEEQFTARDIANEVDPRGLADVGHNKGVVVRGGVKRLAGSKAGERRSSEVMRGG